MYRDIRHARLALQACYDALVKVLATNPAEEPRLSHESELRVAWYAILAAREGLDCADGVIKPFGIQSARFVHNEPGSTEGAPNART